MSGDNYFVMVVDALGTPGKLCGPYNWDKAADVFEALVLKENPDIGAVDLELIKGEGTWSDDGTVAGVHIVQSKEYSDDEDKDEPKTTFSGNGFRLNLDEVYDGEDYLGEFDNERFTPSVFLLECSPAYQRLVEEFAAKAKRYIADGKEIAKK